MELGYELALLYRGSFKSCNYGCSYCSFATHGDSKRDLESDRLALERFVAWVRVQTHSHLGLFFIPYGEALIHRHYRDAIVTLSRQQHVNRVVIQTNLSSSVDWAEDVYKNSVALWASYHPTQVERDAFLDRCLTLSRLKIRYSVGLVAMREHMLEAEQIRKALPSDVYVWLNAYKQLGNYYSDRDLAFWEGIDPLFRRNLYHYPSRGKECHTGQSVFYVDSDGTVKRCPFVSDNLGNIYTSDIAQLRSKAPCPNQSCHCHIGYVHLKELGLYEVFGTGILERIPRLKHDQVSCIGCNSSGLSS